MRSLLARAGLGRTLALAAVAATIVFVFAWQAEDNGFRRGHRGWVTAHTLAIIERATPENGFVGYAMSYAMPGGRELYYFDRYPVFFSTAMHGALHAAKLRAGEKIELSRQLMNVIHVATIVMAAVVLVELGLALEVAIGAAALAAMGYYMVEYRDMVHFDQPALLGWMVLLWAIAGWYRGRGNRRVYLATALAVLSGRGYACFAVLGVWWLVESFDVMRARGTAGVREILAGAPTRACLLSIALAATCLTYNVAVEAHVRNVPVTEVGILGSAAKRLSLDEGFNERKSKRVAWARLADRQSQTFLRGLLPWRRVDRLREGGLPTAVAALSLLAAALAFAATRPPAARKPLLVLCLAGPVWIFAMRDLSAFHSYVAMYYFPLTLTLFAALLHFLPARVHVAVILLACGLQVWGTYRKTLVVTRTGRTAVHDTSDMETIAFKLRSQREITGVPKHRKLFPGVPFALGFYFPNHDIVVDGRSSMVITRERDFRGHNLTPHNRRLFLYHTEKPYRVRTALGGRHADERGQLARQLRQRHQARKRLQ